MILKLIIFAIAGLLIYKFFGGKLPELRKKSTSKEEKPDGDTLVECSQCGTYVTVKEATLINGKYCCDECV